MLLLLLSVAEKERASMAKNVTMYVGERADGKWNVSRPKSKRASAVLERKRDAIERAHEIADGGPVHIQGADGKWRKEQRPPK